jgi:hypothetical protein
MFAHDFAGMRAVLEQMWVGNLTLELFEAFPFALDKEIKIHNDVAGLYQPPKKPRKRSRLYNNLSFFLGARGFGTAVTAGEFFDTPGSIDELLFACEKGMTSSTNTDLNIPTRRAGVIYRTARAHDIGLVILWMNACFHLQKGARNVTAQSWSRKG